MSGDVIDASGTPDGAWVAYASSTGQAHLRALSSEREVQILPSVGGITSVRLEVGGTLGWATSASGSHLFALADPAREILTVAGSAARLDSAGTQVAFVAADGRLAVAPLSGSALGQVTYFSQAGDSAHEPAWSSDGRLSFWLRRADGSQAVMALDSMSNQAVVVAVLALPSGMVSGVVCPAWLGRTLYFGDYENGRFGVFQASVAQGAWAVTQFVVSSDSEHGYSCPQTVQGF